MLMKYLERYVNHQTEDLITDTSLTTAYENIT